MRLNFFSLMNSRPLGLVFSLILSAWMLAVAFAQQSSPSKNQNTADDAPAPTTSQLVSHPAFNKLIDESLPWNFLSAQSFELDHSKPVLLFSPSRQNLPELNLSLRRVLVNPLNKPFAERLNFTLASPAWWPILDQRLVYSNQINPRDAMRNYVLCSQNSFNVLNTYPEVDVLAFQQPNLNYRLSDFQKLIQDITLRYQVDPERIGQESRNARKGRFRLLEANVDLQQVSLDVSNLHSNIGVVLANASSVDLSRPSNYLQTILIISQANELDQIESIGRSQREKLFATAREVLERSWKAWEDEEFRMFLTQPFKGALSNSTAVYGLGESSRMLILEKQIPGGNQQRALKFLSKLEEIFVGADGTVSDQVTQLSQGPTVSTDWCQLHNRALLCQARLMWRGKEADLSWLEEASDLARDPENPRFPPALLPPFPGDPDSLIGVIYLGQACLMASEIHPQNRQLWINRSRALFELLEERYGAGERGYRMIAQGHPFEIPPEAFFASSPDQSNSLVTKHGTWLRALEAVGVEAAGKRADELLNSYTRWRLVRNPSSADLFFTRGITLQKPSGQE